MIKTGGDPAEGPLIMSTEEDELGSISDIVNKYTDPETVKSRTQSNLLSSLKIREQRSF
jgi:hypothetical protein